MGCFDELVITCPSCGGQAVFQSKAGSCVMAEFTLDTVPPEVAGDLNEEYSECEGCGNPVVLRTQVIVTPVWR